MNKLACRFFALFIVFIGAITVYSGNGSGAGPPAPAGKQALVPAPPPGLPIDDSIFILFSLAILFGIHTIYNNDYKAKKTI
jgi:hypothetical protein